MNKQNRNRLTDTENRLVVARAERAGGKVKGLRGTDWQLQNGRGDVKGSRGDMVDNTVVPKPGARWGLEIPGGPLCKAHARLTTTLYT